MSLDLPCFLNVPGDDTAARNWTGKPGTAPTGEERQARHDRPALFVTAQETGLTLVSGNVSDMDLLLQVDGSASLLLYAI